MSEIRIVKIYIKKKFGKPKGVQPIQDFSKIKKIIAVPNNPRHKLLLAVGFITGYRISDILHMKVRDLKSEEICLTEQKTNKERRVKISKVLRKYIDEVFKSIGILKNDDYIFISQKSKTKPMSRQHADRIIKDACRKVGISDRVGTHTMRKTSACLIRDSHPDRAIAAQQFLQHATLEETYTYLWMHNGYMDDAVDGASLLLEKS